MGIRHVNSYGYVENLDNPLEDCSCDGCVQGRKEIWGDQWEQGGETFTVNPTADPQAPGGYYLSINETGNKKNKATAVFNEDDTPADTKANRSWRDV